MAIYLTGSEQATENYAEEYAKSLVPGDIVLLEGDMGAGKTVFCKGIAKGLGIKEEVLSPTYAYMNDYSGKLYHFDCYRIKNAAQAERMGLTDYFLAGGVCVIEWAENIKEVLPKGCKKVKIVKISSLNREIICE